VFGTTATVATTTTTTVGPTETGLPPPPDASPVALGDGPSAPVIYKVPTNQPVVFLTIDDGFVRDPQVVSYLRSMHLPVTVFLLTAAGRQAPGYFRSLRAAGATIEDHTMTHPRLPTLPMAAQKKELCDSASDDARTYGTRPTLMRPPYGLANRVTQAAAAACGLRAVVEWTAVVANGRLTAIGGRLQPGYIIILHFTPSLLGDLHLAVAAIQSAGLTVGRLESYLT
jgi:peptidoglycan/xylan/chitin deacetylase (PgdA/CDA1 family)